MTPSEGTFVIMNRNTDLLNPRPAGGGAETAPPPPLRFLA